MHPDRGNPHDRIALEMAFVEPEVRLDIQFGNDETLAVLAAIGGDFRDAVEHEHRRCRQQCIAGAKQLTISALDQVVVGETRFFSERAHANVAQASCRQKLRDVSIRCSPNCPKIARFGPDFPES